MQSVDNYYAGLNTAIQEARCGVDWDSRFLEALDEHGLKLAEEQQHGDNYPICGAFRAPSPFDDPNAWPLNSWVVWK